MEKTIVLALVTGQKRFSVTLCKLVEKYAEILASQGQLTMALEYIKISCLVMEVVKVALPLFFFITVLIIHDQNKLKGREMQNMGLFGTLSPSIENLSHIYNSNGGKILTRPTTVQTYIYIYISLVFQPEAEHNFREERAIRKAEMEATKRTLTCISTSYQTDSCTLRIIDIFLCPCIEPIDSDLTIHNCSQ
uniref:Uncharacterized protein n=1 Tax=Cucumis melo TaxID=3656 RepID=A0A9I9E6R6_CUCME